MFSSLKLAGRKKREAANQWSGHGRPSDQCNGALITDRHSARLSHWSAPLVIIKARILLIQNHSSFEFAFQSDINIVCIIEVQCCVQVLMLCDQERQILPAMIFRNSVVLYLCNTSRYSTFFRYCKLWRNQPTNPNNSLSSANIKSAEIEKFWIWPLS